MRPNVLLINAPTFKIRSVGLDNYFPIGLLYIASLIRKNDIDVSMLDLNNHFFDQDLNEDVLDGYIESDLSTYLTKNKPDVVGIGCTFSGAFKSLKMIAKKTKEVLPSVPIVIGGIHPTVFSKEILEKYEYIDYVVIGEGEIAFLNLIRNIAANRNNRVLSSMDGIAFRDGGHVVMNPKTKFENNLDALPFIDFSLIDLNKYKNDTSSWYSPKKIQVGQPFTMISSRSCPNRCTFCSMWLVHGPRFRFRSAGNVLDEMESLYHERGVRYFQFMDDNLTFDKKRILEICKGMKKRKLNIQFDTPDGLAISRLDQEIIDAMVDAGLIYVCFGIESGSEYIRNGIMKKGLPTEKIYEIVEACAKYKHLFIKGFFIIGMPQDTHETLNETYEMIKRLPFDKLSVNFVALYPGTELFKYCVDRGLFKHKQQGYVDIEVFQDSDDQPHFKPPNLTIEDLVVFRKKCFDWVKEKRKGLGIPDNYPIRFKG